MSALIPWYKKSGKRSITREKDERNEKKGMHVEKSLVSFTIKKHLLNKNGWVEQRLNSKWKCYGDAAECYRLYKYVVFDALNTKLYTLCSKASTALLVVCLVNFQWNIMDVCWMRDLSEQQLLYSTSNQAFWRPAQTQYKMTQ